MNTDMNIFDEISAIVFIFGTKYFEFLRQTFQISVRTFKKYVPSCKSLCWVPSKNYACACSTPFIIMLLVHFLAGGIGGKAMEGSHL